MHTNGHTSTLYNSRDRNNLPAHQQMAGISRVCVCVCVCARAHTSTCMCVCTCVCMCVSAHVCACTRVHLCVRAYVCMCVSARVPVCAYIYVCTRAFPFVQTAQWFPLLPCLNRKVSIRIERAPGSQERGSLMA